jgi:hypothetical protein
MSESITVENFVVEFGNRAIHFLVYLLKDSYFLWIGSAPASMNALALSIPTPYVRSNNVQSQFTLNLYTREIGQS